VLVDATFHGIMELIVEYQIEHRVVVIITSALFERSKVRISAWILDVLTFLLFFSVAEGKLVSNLNRQLFSSRALPSLSFMTILPWVANFFLDYGN
jgi:hypothetical protein